MCENNHDIYNICVLPGDGIGPEVVDAVLPVLDALAISCNLVFEKIGWECWKNSGDTVPLDTWAAIERCDATLLGAVTSKPLKEAQDALPEYLKNNRLEFVSPVIQLRQHLELYANIRPISDIMGNDRFKFVVIRENTEGLYAGMDYHPLPPELEKLIVKRESMPHSWRRYGNDDSTATVRLQTQFGIDRLIDLAFNYALENEYESVTWVDKPNVLRRSGNFARNCVEMVAGRYPTVRLNIENVDAVGLWMVRRPERFGVIVSENMFGDILSDVGAGVMGGLGLAPSENTGVGRSYFEPVHGSAPKYAGLNMANPSAMFLTLAMLLKHLGEVSASEAINYAVKKVARSSTRTFDIGGVSSTSEVAKAIIAEAATF